MNFTRVFKKNITLVSVNEIYETNINDLLIDKIKQDLERKCYKSCFILSINKIIARSDINFNNKDLNASANISVKFEASILQYDKYDIVNNIKITAITEQKIICQSENSSIFIQYEDRLSDYKTGQIIPIKIGVCKYYLGEDSISINAFPFVPLLESIGDDTYYNINNLTDIQIAELNNLDIIKKIESVEEEKKKILSLKNNRWDHFNELLYPYKSIKKINKNNKEINLLDFDKLESDKTNTIYLPASYDISKKSFLLVNKTNKTNQKKFSDENYPVEENSLIPYIIYLTKYYKHIKSVNEMSVTYSDDDIFNDNESVFDIYRQNKL